MPSVVSADGTTIGYTKVGSGPAVILVDGALCWRAQGPAGPLAEQLKDTFTVYTYDRRGRGESGDAPGYTPQREIDDLAALIKEAGGSAYVYGISSGAALALEAANAGLPIDKLALYEAPYVVDGLHPIPADYFPRMSKLIADGDRGGALWHFMANGVGVPKIAVAMMRITPVWGKLKPVAHTLPYDAELLWENQQGRDLPADRWTGATMPTLVGDGGKSPAWMRNSQAQLAKVLPNATAVTLPGQTHMLKPEAIAPVLKEFFLG